MRYHWSVVGLVVMGWLFSVAAVPAFAQTTTIAAGNIEGVAGETVTVPIEMSVPTGAQMATMQFNLTVVPEGSAPALVSQVTFTSDVGMPSLELDNGFSTHVVGWLTNFSPILTGAVDVGKLNVPIPPDAEVGDTYTVQMLKPSGTSDGVVNLPMTGEAGQVEVVPPTPYLVCDVLPSTGDGTGQFGDGQIDNSDVEAIFNASLFASAQPAPATARFSAMDSITEDDPPMCGGDGVIENSDVVACFRRSLGLSSPNYEREGVGASCTSSVP